jgi:hypothetical protein
MSLRLISVSSRNFVALPMMIMPMLFGIVGCSERDAPVVDVAAVNGEPTAPLAATATELPTWKIPNIPKAAEAYYAPDSFHVIAQVQDPDAQKPGGRGGDGTLTYLFTDQGEEVIRINDRGQDGCSYYFPDRPMIVWTSTRDNMEMPVGNWFDERDYPRGAELYSSDLEGNNVRRLTDNEWYDAEVSVSPDGEWIVFGRQIDGKMDLWRMRPDGSDEQQITATDDWQEGAPFYLPDSETILFRAWKRSEFGRIEPTPMTVFTIKHDGTGLTQRTFDRDMNWAPYPGPDGRHYVFVRIVEDNNWEIFLGDLAGGEPVRLTFNPGFDGLPALSPDGMKMLFARTEGKGFGGGIYTYVMDVSSLDLGPQHYTRIPSIAAAD